MSDALPVLVGRSRFFAQFADGREEPITITLFVGETMDDAVHRIRKEIGATAIVLKEAQVSAE